MKQCLNLVRKKIINPPKKYLKTKKNLLMFRQCPDLMALIESTALFDLVLDFSGYEAKWIHDNCVVLKGKVSQGPYTEIIDL